MLHLSALEISSYFKLLPGNSTALSVTHCARLIKMSWLTNNKTKQFPNAFHLVNGTCAPAVVSPLQQLKLDSSPPLARAPEAAYIAYNCVGKGKF